MKLFFEKIEMDNRTRGINFIACPSCSRMNFDVIGTMNQLESRLEDIKEDVKEAAKKVTRKKPGRKRKKN